MGIVGRNEAIEKGFVYFEINSVVCVNLFLRKIFERVVSYFLVVLFWRIYGKNKEIFS